LHRKFPHGRLLGLGGGIIWQIWEHSCGMTDSSVTKARRIQPLTLNIRAPRRISYCKNK
jgi:hypothetical protein